MNYIELTAQNTLNFPQHGIHLIEASAGTGKTYTVTNLYLNKIIAGKKVSDILVVTFTIAATDELRGRIRQRLHEVLQLLDHSQHNNKQTDDVYLIELIAKLQQEKSVDMAINRLKLAVRSMDEAAIYTIHGFCQRILNEFSFHSGQQFELEFLDNDDELWNQAIRDWWRKTAYPLPSVYGQVFQDNFQNVNAFFTMLRPWLTSTEKILIPESPAWNTIDSLWDNISESLRVLADNWQQQHEELKSIFRESRGISRDKSKPYHPDKLTTAFVSLDAYFEDIVESGKVAFPIADFNILTRSELQKAKLKKHNDERLDDRFFDQCEELSQTINQFKSHVRIWAIHDALAYARNRVEEIKQQLQSLSFHDLLTRLHDALHGASARSLLAMVRKRYPCAMIDEFQDTDPLQYGIFRRIYASAEDTLLIMIGDPKQAIYSFRGGDIFTYMQAKNDVQDENIYTLNTNWRSTPEVVKAVNRLFMNREDSFVYKSIPYRESRAVDEKIKTPTYLQRNGQTQPAMKIWQFADELYSGKNKTLAKDKANTYCHEAVAREITDLLSEARNGKTLIGDRPLKPNDIAILVRTNHEATELRRVLQRYHINAVSIGRTGVYSSDEALGLKTMLNAVLVPTDRARVRQALSSTLLNYDYIKIDEVINNEDRWLNWLDKITSLHATWQQKGFMPMFQKMLYALDIEQNIGAQPQAERRLTNLLHLGELIQKASKIYPGMDALYNWFVKQCQYEQDNETPEESQLRLETDDELVQIVTIHKSKGLEYPIVFLPYLWNCIPRSANRIFSFHKDNQAYIDAGSAATADSGSGNREQNFYLAEQERLAEDLRLTYVALTRAKSCLYLVWGRAGQNACPSGQTALAYLLHPNQTSESLQYSQANVFAQSVDVKHDLQTLADSSENCICIDDLKSVEQGAALIFDENREPLRPREFSGRVSSLWRVNSFTAMTRGIHPPVHSTRYQAETDLEKSLPVDPVLQFPAGSQVGSFLHLILEHLDFQGDITNQSIELTSRFAERFNINAEIHSDTIAQWMQRIVHTRLNIDNELHLSALSADQRLNEMEFDLATDIVDIARLNFILRDALSETLPENLTETCQEIDADSFAGMITGIIDLVFEYEGRFYIADYKSNYLGNEPASYSRDNMAAAVYGHRYDLQYLLYTLALHRYLRQRLPNYEYEHDFGGVYYLFLRGMHPDTGCQYGIYHDKPAKSLIERMDKEVFSKQGAMA